MKKDYWAILGLKPGASEKEIRSAYRKLARKHHPDVNPNNKQAEERFKEIGEAHEVLTDPKKRQAWEMGGPEFDFFGQGGPRPGGGRTYRWDSGGPTGAGGFSTEGDFGSILNDLFSGMGRSGARGGAGPFEMRGSDLQYEAEISFEEAVNGTTLRIPLARTVTCDVCGGTGRIRSGSRRATACTRCGGTGVQRASEDIQARIPPGAEDGSRVRLPGKGEAGERGAPPGDLFIQLRVRSHRFFRREGRDILLDVPLTFTEAALGTRLEVPTLGGKVALTIPPGTSSGQRLRLKGRGVASISAGERGDQIVIVQIVAPKPDDSTGKLLEELAKHQQVDPRAGLGW